ncbi:MAG: GGDEF domain-containing protein [Trueperaceae bacterium]
MRHLRDGPAPQAGVTPSWTGVAILKRRIYLILLPLLALLTAGVAVGGYLEPTRSWWISALVAIGACVAWGVLWRAPQRMRTVERSLLFGTVFAWATVLMINVVPVASADVDAMLRLGSRMPALAAFAFLSLPASAATVVAAACWALFAASVGLVGTFGGGLGTTGLRALLDATLVYAMAIVLMRGLVHVTFGTQRRADRWETVAATDALTGLPNRRAAEEHLRREIDRAQRHGGGVAVVWFDLDRFKDLNDAHGHDVGDAVLRQVGQALLPSLRGHDLLARWGGEEFVVILADQDRQAPVRTAERLQVALASHGMERAVGVKVRVTGSFGVAAWRRGVRVNSRATCCGGPTWRCTEPRPPDATGWTPTP